MDWDSNFQKGNVCVCVCLCINHFIQFFINEEYKTKYKHKMRKIQSRMCFLKNMIMLQSPILLCSPHNRPVNKRTSIRELADREDGRLVPQNNHCIGAWMPGSFIDQREGSNKELN